MAHVSEPSVENEFVPAPHIDSSMKLFTALAMLLVVVGHVRVDAGFSGPFAMFPPYSFHVAAFIFASGYFYKSTYETDFLGFIKKKSLRLLLPLYLINAAYGLLTTLLTQFGFTCFGSLSAQTLLIDPLTNGHQFLLNVPMWFIAPLFFAELANMAIRKTLFRFTANRLPPPCSRQYYLLSTYPLAHGRSPPADPRASTPGGCCSFAERCFSLPASAAADTIAPF